MALRDVERASVVPSRADCQMSIVVAVAPDENTPVQSTDHPFVAPAASEKKLSVSTLPFGHLTSTRMLLVMLLPFVTDPTMDVIVVAGE